LDNFPTIRRKYYNNAAWLPLAQNELVLTPNSISKQ
jgi:hypothetical protein